MLLCFECTLCESLLFSRGRFSEPPNLGSVVDDELRFGELPEDAAPDGTYDDEGEYCG